MNKYSLSVIFGMLFSSFASSTESGAKIVDSYAFGGACGDGEFFTQQSLDGPFVKAIFSTFDVSSSEGYKGEHDDFCNLRLNLKVPDGYQVAMGDVEYQGVIVIPKGGKVAFDSYLDFAYVDESSSLEKRLKHEGSTGVEVKRFKWKQATSSEGLIWSSCGGSSLFDVTASAVTLEGEDGKNTRIIINSISIDFGGKTSGSGGQVKLKYRKC